MTPPHGETRNTPPAAGSPDDRDLRQRLIRDLDGEVAFDDYTRHLFSRDASMYAITPRAVLFPGTRVMYRPPWRRRSTTACRYCRAVPEPASPDRPSAPAWSSTSPAI